ncbi:MAG: hypothetical protein ACRCVD_14735 [Halioglobus sp.]
MTHFVEVPPQRLQDIRLQVLWRYFYKLRHVFQVQAIKAESRSLV